MDKTLQNLNQYVFWSLHIFVYLSPLNISNIFEKTDFGYSIANKSTIQPSAVLTNTLPLESDKLACKGNEIIDLIPLME